MTPAHIDDAVNCRLLPIQAHSFYCYVKLEKLLPKVISSKTFKAFNVTEDVGDLADGKYIDTDHYTLLFKQDGNWFILAPLFDVYNMDVTQSTLYTNFNDREKLKSFIGRFFKYENDDRYSLMKTPFIISHQRARSNIKYRWFQRNITPAEFEKLIPVFQTPEATIYTDIHEIEKAGDKFSKEKGFWSFQHSDASSLYVRADENNCMVLIMSEEKAALGMEGDPLVKGVNAFFEQTIGRQMNPLEKELVGTIFVKPFIEEESLQHHILLSKLPEPEYEETGHEDWL